jgi:hypothetical protein
MPELKCTVPELPEEFNPDGLEVEYSPIGMTRSGKWEFYWSVGRWERSHSVVHESSMIYARLIPRKPEQAFIDEPIFDGCFQVPGISNNLTPGNYSVGKQFSGTPYAIAGYVYADGTASQHPIQYRYDCGGWGQYDPDCTHYRRATHVRLVDLSKLPEVK